MHLQYIIFTTSSSKCTFQTDDRTNSLLRLYLLFHRSFQVWYKCIYSICTTSSHKCTFQTSDRTNSFLILYSKNHSRDLLCIYCIRIQLFHFSLLKGASFKLRITVSWNTINTSLQFLHHKKQYFNCMSWKNKFFLNSTFSSLNMDQAKNNFYTKKTMLTLYICQRSVCGQLNILIFYP
jgi:hypothetical protein